MDEVRDQRFKSLSRQLELNQLYPPEAARSAIGWPLEIRRPYADRRLHEFLLAIPPEQKFTPHPESDEFYAGSKQMLRRGLKGILPESIRTRIQPTHFGAVFADEVKERWGLYESVFHPSMESEIAERGYIDRNTFWSRLQTLRDTDEYGSDFIYLIRMVALETWLRTFHLPRSQQINVPTRWGDPALITDGGVVRQLAHSPS
jgi:asparagine synthase (glutamine-hydrolysing)